MPAGCTTTSPRLNATAAARVLAIITTLGTSVFTGCADTASPSPRAANRTEPEIKPFSDLGLDNANFASSATTRDASSLDGSVPRYVAFGSTLITTPSGLPQNADKAKLDDGRAVEITRHRINLVPVSPSSSTEAVALRWLGGALRWSEASAAPVTPGAALELVELKLPVDSYGHWLWIGESRVNIAWLSDEKAALPRADADLLKRAEDPFVRECLRLESADPRLAWRAALLNITVPKPASEPAPIPFATTPGLIEAPQDASFLDRLADQTASLWRASLMALRRSDERLFRQVIDQLVLIVEIESGGRRRVIPAWPGPDECASLLDQLLPAIKEPRRIAAAAREWLLTRPAACAWVADDAGLVDLTSGVPLVRVGVANLGQSRMLVSASGVIDGTSPELTPLASRSAAVLSIPPLLTPAPVDGSAEQWGIEVRCGDWSGTIDAQRRHLSALPPGLTIGALSLDHSAAAWTRSRSLFPLTNPSESRRDLPALVGRLVRDAGSVGVGSGWSLYLEAERSTSERQTIRVFFGPFASSSAVITAELPEITSIPESGEGTATVRLPGRPESALIGSRVVPSSDRWTVRLPIPNSAIERPGLLRLAIEHVRGNARSTWPRAQFPWQTEPGRASIDLTRW